VKIWCNGAPSSYRRGRTPRASARATAAERL
jgi:hypothetical protein